MCVKGKSIVEIRPPLKLNPTEIGQPPYESGFTDDRNISRHRFLLSCQAFLLGFKGLIWINDKANWKFNDRARQRSIPRERSQDRRCFWIGLIRWDSPPLFPVVRIYIPLLVQCRHQLDAEHKVINELTSLQTSMIRDTIKCVIVKSNI